MNGLEPLATAFLGGTCPIAATAIERVAVDLKSGLELLLKAGVGFVMIEAGLAMMGAGLAMVGVGFVAAAAAALLYTPAVVGLAMGEGEECRAVLAAGAWN